MKILICDDSPTDREFLRVCLKKYGEITVANDGMTGIACVRKAFEAKKPFDLICLDVSMPCVNGCEVLERIRTMEQTGKNALYPAAKVMMVTGNDESCTIYSAYNFGCDAYLTKPLTQNKVITRVKTLGLGIEEEDDNEQQNESDQQDKQKMLNSGKK